MKFWSGMLQKISLKNSDIIMLGNPSTGQPEYVTFGNLTKKYGKTYVQQTDPTSNPENEVKNGDVWINQKTTYTRIENKWINQKEFDILFSPQTLKDVEKAQARENIGVNSTFYQPQDPVLNSDNKVKNGDVWHYNGTPYTKYERIEGVWISIGSGGGSAGMPNFFTADIFNMNGDVSNTSFVFNASGESSYILNGNN